MNVVRDHPEGRWLPSRFRFAAFRLFAYAIFRPEPARQSGLVLAIDRDQTAVEQYTIAVWTTVTVTCFAYGFLERAFVRPVAAILAPVAAFVAINLFVTWRFLGPAAWRERNRMDANSFTAMFVITMAALYLAATEGPVRYVAVFFLACLAVNAIAAIAVRLMPERFAAQDVALAEAAATPSLLHRRWPRRVILAGVFVAPVIAVALWWWSPYAALGVVMLSHALVLYPTLRANAQWLGPVATRFAPAGKEVWLTIDDGPAADTSALLDALDSRGARATFFVKGTLATDHPDLVRAIVARGHTVANHSYSHPSASFWCLPAQRIRREIAECNRTLREITGAEPMFFRAPVGMKNPFVHPALGSMPLVGWSARAFDTTTSDPEAVLRRLLPDVSSGAILLLHQGRPRSVEIVGRVVDALQRDGYSFVIPDAGRLKTKR